MRLHPPDWSYDPEELAAAAASPRARLVLLNTPHNPTGKVFTEGELGQVAALCRAHDLLAVTDEVYEHLVFDGAHAPLATLPGMRERTLTVSSGGKTFSFTGWKVGWASGPAPLVAAVRAAKQFLTYTSPAPFQLAVARGLGMPPASLRSFADALGAKRDRLCDGLEELGHTVYRPAATYFVNTDIAGVAPGLSAAGLLPRPPRALRRGGHPELGLLRPRRRRRGADAGAVGLLQARPRPGRRAGPLSIVGTMTIPVTWVDAFSDVPCGGNPAGVCLLEEPLDEARMQSIAFELGIAETAFLTRSEDPDTFALRWFSPATEIDLCGHATLAAAHALRENGTVGGARSLTFNTRSGPLRAAFDGDRIELDFPADPVTPGPLPVSVRGQWPGAVVTSGGTSFFAFVVLDSAEAVRTYEPDLGAIAAAGTRALLLTAAAAPESGADYVLRVFGPNVGIPEDPATGAAQCAAGPYWAAALGREALVARQLSRRGGTLYVRPDGDRVRIAGHATTVLTGHLCDGFA